MSTAGSRPNLLQESTGPIKSRMGAFFPGSHVLFRGHNLHTELKDMDWLELYVFGITGRRFSENQLRLMHAIWTYTSYPDVRIWNNRVAALAGSARSTAALGIGAALAVSDAAIYGGGVSLRAIDFLLRTREQLDEGKTLADCISKELETHRSIGGYGRPIINSDERNQHMLTLARDLGLDQGPYLQLALSLEETLLNGRWRMRMNYGGLAAALAADLGMLSEEYYLFVFPAFLAGMPPGFIERTERPEGTLYPMSCVDILYEGQPQRGWHRDNKK